jgi:hypothetical protein
VIGEGEGEVGHRGELLHWTRHGVGLVRHEAIYAAFRGEGEGSRRGLQFGLELKFHRVHRKMQGALTCSPEAIST